LTDQLEATCFETRKGVVDKNKSAFVKKKKRKRKEEKMMEENVEEKKKQPQGNDSQCAREKHAE
jgi:hypothetical protein